MSTTPPSVWSVQGHDGGTILDPTTPPASLGDFKAWLRVPNPSQEAVDDALMTQVLVSAWEELEAEAGPIAPTAYVEREDGWSGNTIMLRHEPVISVTYVNEFWSTGGLHVLQESTPGNSIDGYQIDRTTGELVRVFQGNWPRTWFPGSYNVEFSYVAGFDPMPALASQALCQLAVHRWTTELQGRAIGTGAISIDEEDQGAGSGSGQWVGIPNKVLATIRRLRTPVLG